MDVQTAILIVTAACTVVVTIATWGFATGRFVAQSNPDQFTNALNSLRADVSRRFDEAGKELSKAMTYVQGMESRFLREFINRELADTQFAAIHRELDQLRQELRAIKTRHNT